MSVTVYEILSILICLQFTHHISIPDHFYSDFPVSFILEVWIWCHACCTAARNTWMFSLSQVWPGTSGWAVSKLGYRRCGQRVACKASWIEVGIHFEQIFCVFVNLEMLDDIRILLFFSLDLFFAPFTGSPWASNFVAGTWNSRVWNSLESWLLKGSSLYPWPKATWSTGLFWFEILRQPPRFHKSTGGISCFGSRLWWWNVFLIRPWRDVRSYTWGWVASFISSDSIIFKFGETKCKFTRYVPRWGSWCCQHAFLWW